MDKTGYIYGEFLVESASEMRMRLMTQKIRPLQCRQIKQTLNLEALLDEVLKVTSKIELIGKRHQKYMYSKSTLISALQ